MGGDGVFVRSALCQLNRDLGAISAFTGDDVAYGAQIAGGAVDYGLVAVDLEVGEQVLDGLGLLEDGVLGLAGRASTDTVMVF